MFLFLILKIIKFIILMQIEYLKEKYTYSIYTDFKLRGDTIHKDQAFENPNIRTVNDYIVGNTGNRLYFLNISYKDDHWIMLASTFKF